MNRKRYCICSTDPSAKIKVEWFVSARRVVSRYKILRYSEWHGNSKGPSPHTLLSNRSVCARDEQQNHPVKSPRHVTHCLAKVAHPNDSRQNSYWRHDDDERTWLQEKHQNIPIHTYSPFNNAVCALDMQQNHMATIWVVCDPCLRYLCNHGIRSYSAIRRGKLTG